MLRTVKTLLYPFLFGVRLFSTFRRGKIFMYCLAYLFMFSFEGLLFFEILSIPGLLRTLIILYVIFGMIYIEFYIEDEIARTRTPLIAMNGFPAFNL